MRRLCKISPMLRRLLIAVAGLIVFAPLTLAAQNCALCYTQAASTTARFLHALRSGILIMMIPPFLMSVAFTVVAYRRRNTFYTPQ
jgi:hypothetical protein